MDRTDARLRNQQPSVVTVWSDIGCPWASLALHVLRAAIRDHPAEPAIGIDHRAFPLELFNRRPTPRLILDAEVSAIGGSVPDLGWRPYSGDPSSYAVATLPAMEAVQAAKGAAVGGLRASDQLDEALRHAFYRHGRCITMHHEIVDIASTCSAVNCDALEDLLNTGVARRLITDQFEVAQQAAIEGSPHLFASNGFDRHNPGVAYSWTEKPPNGFVTFTSHEPRWATDLIDSLVG